ncbi:TPA: hypothetical protein ACKP5U_003297 [Pseudomonas aeruginosa]|uniref:hypothetical protein n=1 Tax=Pseudomonas aeruginosa TaxID=287 RepID=UPI001C0F3A93|nr:hypothetical protein [Pseudomonas aeruginosa]HEJ2170541.1 hypothetical protein [Pseudomonas aeruginosa]HEK1445028.1 hypothetical protein [Pseudomonas aeruginosa]
MTDHAELWRLAKRADALHGTPSLEHVFAITKFREAVEPKAILALLDEIDGLKAENEILRRFAAEAYQVLGALDAHENVLDNASDAANGVPLRHETLLPFFAEDYESMRKDAERYRFYRQGFVSPRELDTNIDAALEGATQ